MNGVVLITGPNGVGKGSLTTALTNSYGNDFERVVRYSTRPMRPNEINGLDYNFITPEDFDELRRNEMLGEFVQFEHGSYGTKTEDVLNVVERNKIAVLDIDIKSAFKLHDLFSSMGVNSLPLIVSPVSR